MKSRIITGIIGISLMLVVLTLPPIALIIATSVICAGAVIELLLATHFNLHRSILIASAVFSALTPFFMLGKSRMFALITIFVYLLVMVIIQTATHKTQPVEHTSFAFAMSLIFPLSFSCIAYLRTFNERDGLFYVILAIAIPWMCDMGAYFIGTFFGKHKLCPELSPKKTIEGLIGGIIVSVLSAIVCGLLYQAVLKQTATVNLLQIGLLALVCAPLSVIGDLFASLIKRQCHVKDFGNIMPGHGGIMDRFDSMLLSAPLIFIAVHYLPLVK